MSSLNVTCTSQQSSSSSADNRAKLLIISNENFERKDVETREGNNCDVTQLLKVAKRLGIEADLKQDKTKLEIIEAIKKHADEFDEVNNMVMVFVMTHGNEYGTLFAKDTHYNTKDLWEPFLYDEKFNGKLKLFVINACRGESGEPKIGPNVTEHIDLSFGTNFPHKKDFLVAYSSMETHSSYRSQETGTLFIQSLCKILEEIKEKTEVLNFFIQVTNRVSIVAYRDKNEGTEGWVCQTPVIVSSMINYYTIEPSEVELSTTLDSMLSHGTMTSDAVALLRRQSSLICTDGQKSGEPVENLLRYTMKNPKIIVFHAKDTKSFELQALQDHFHERLNYTSESEQINHQTLDQLQQLSKDKKIKYFDGLILVIHGYLKKNENSFGDNLLKIGDHFYRVSEFISKFTSKNCNSLRQKPKIFLFFEDIENLKKDAGDPEPSYEENTQLINNNVDMLVFFGFENKILNCFSTELSTVKDGENVLNILQKSMHSAQDTNANTVPHFQSTLTLDLFFGLNTLENQVSTLKTENEDLKNEISSSETDKNQLQQDKSILENQVSTVQSDKIDLINEKYKIEVEKKNLESLVSTLSSDKYKLETEKSKIEEDSTKTITQLEFKVSTLESDNITLQTEKTNIEEENSKTISQLDQKVSSLEINYKNLETEKSQIEDEKTELTLKNSCLEIKVSTLVRDKYILEAEKSQIEKEKTELTEKKSSLEIKVSILESDKNKLETEKSRIKEDNSKTISQFDQKAKALEIEIKNLETEKSQIEDEKIGLTEKNSCLEFKVSTLESDKITLQTEKTKIEEENSKIVSQLDEQLNEHMKKEKNQDNKIEEIQKENQNLLTKKNDVENKNSELMKEINKLIAQIQSMNKELEAVKPFINNEIRYNAAESELAIKDYNNGDNQKALRRFNNVYESRRSLLGEDNVDTLYSLWKADTLRELGNYNEAITIYDVVIEKRKKVLGVDHASTLISMHNKAYTLDKLGRSQDAIDLYDIVIEKRKKVLGVDHASTLQSMHNKACTLNKMGRYQSAIDLFDIVIEKGKKVLGEEHAETLKSMDNKASTLESMGRYQDAIDLYDIVIEKRKKLLGEEHAYTLTSMHNKAYTLDKMGRYQDAIDLYDIVIMKQKKVLGDEHASTLLSIKNKADTLKRVG